MRFGGGSIDDDDDPLLDLLPVAVASLSLRLSAANLSKPRLLGLAR